MWRFETSRGERSAHGMGGITHVNHRLHNIYGHSVDKAMDRIHPGATLRSRLTRIGKHRTILVFNGGAALTIGNDSLRLSSQQLALAQGCIRKGGAGCPRRKMLPQLLRWISGRVGDLVALILQTCRRLAPNLNDGSLRRRNCWASTDVL